ncbi:MAG: metallophosphoesterase [Eubacteriales bacterium]|nr:metallophosphoesterase [Eubacteriales bacterium]
MAYRGRHERRSPFSCLARIITFLVLVAMLIYPFAEPFMLEVENVILTSSDLPADIGQLRIVYLSDIHQGSFFSQSRVDSLVKRINALNADLVLLGGDYAEDSDGAVAFFRSLPNIHARYGVYAVMGNHDRTVPESNLQAMQTIMIAKGITPVVNGVIPVRIGVSNIYIAGIDDVNTGWPDLSGVAARTRAEDYVIFLSHSPEVIPDAHKCADMNGRRGWFDLGLFGHTHGGQIALIGQYLGIAKVPAQYEQGWIVENRINMLISRGVGTSVLPVRIGRRPQIHVITVKSK